MATAENAGDFAAKALSVFEEMRPFLPMYLHLVVSALFPIYAGSYASLSRPSSAAAPQKSGKKELGIDEEEDEEEHVVKMEGLTPQDAIVFPVTAGVVLAGLYYLIKTYGAELINYILAWYFAIVGVYSVTQFINDALTLVWSFILPDYFLDRGELWRVSTRDRKTLGVADQTSVRLSPLPGMLGRIAMPAMLRDVLWRQRDALKTKYVVKGYAKSFLNFKLAVTRHNVFSALAGTAVVVYANFFAQSWYLTNLQGFSVSYGALQLMSPTSFGTGSLILSALFAYDIWAVFFTPLMVTVAKNLDVPIKLVFPRPDDSRSFSMLGLGDIVIPGIMIAMALRFDLYLFYLKKQQPGIQLETQPNPDDNQPSIQKAPYVPVTGHWGTRYLTRGADKGVLPARYSGTFPKVYFVASLIGYTIGLIVTLVAMNISQHAQPALLYLVPGVLTSLWITSLVRGEIKAMWEFSEGIDLDPEATDAAKGDAPSASASSTDGSLWGWITTELLGMRPAQDTTKESTTEKTSDSKDATATKSAKANVVISFTVTKAAESTAETLDGSKSTKKD